MLVVGVEHNGIEVARGKSEEYVRAQPTGSASDSDGGASPKSRIEPLPTLTVVV